MRPTFAQKQKNLTASSLNDIDDDDDDDDDKLKKIKNMCLTAPKETIPVN